MKQIIIAIVTILTLSSCVESELEPDYTGEYMGYFSHSPNGRHPPSRYYVNLTVHDNKVLSLEVKGYSFGYEAHNLNIVDGSIFLKQDGYKGKVALNYSESLDAFIGTVDIFWRYNEEYKGLKTKQITISKL